MMTWTKPEMFDCELERVGARAPYTRAKDVNSFQVLPQIRMPERQTRAVDKFNQTRFWLEINQSTSFFSV